MPSQQDTWSDRPLATGLSREAMLSGSELEAVMAMTSIIMTIIIMNIIMIIIMILIVMTTIIVE